MNNDELFADLFAYRFMLMDENLNNNETEIIKKLKYKLIEIGKNYNELNDILFEFYNHYELNVPLEQIQNSYVNNLTDIIYYFVVENRNINNLLTNFINNNNIQEVEDSSILTEEEVNRIPLITIEEELEDECSICFESIPIGSSIYNIPCSHKFHLDCLKSQLINYNRTCPLCRNECISNNNI